MDVPTSSQVTGVANTLLRQAGLPRVVHGIEQCGSVLFGQLYEALTGARPPGGGESEAERCQAVVDAFSEQLAPHVSLEHIRGRDLASRDPITIINLLDIFSVLFHVPTVRRDPQSLHRDRDTTTDDDDHPSNLLPDQGLGIVLQDEIGDSAQHHTLFSSSYSTNSTAELLRPVPPVHIYHLTPPPSLTIMSLTPSTIDQSETAPPTGEGVGTDNSSSTWRSSKGQLATPSTPPPETRLLNSPLHHSTPRPHPSRSRIPPPPPSVTSFPLEKPARVQQPSSFPPLPLPSASPSESLTSSCTEAGKDTEEEEGGETTLTNTLREQEVENPNSILEQDPGNGTAEENHTPVSSTPEPTPSPSGGRKIGPPTPGEKERRDILSSLYQRYLEAAGPSQSRCRQKKTMTGVYRQPSRKRGVKPGGQRSGTLASSRAKDDSREDKKKLGVTSDLFPVVEASLPVCPVSMETVKDLWRKQLRQITTLTKPTPSHPHRVDQQIEAMGRKHSALLESLKKEVDHTRRLRGQEEARAQQRAVRAKLETKRQATARARRYFRDYELELKAKLQKKRTNEELVFRRAFEDGLALLKEREREVRRMAKEKKEQQKERLRRDLEAMEQVGMATCMKHFV
ncbi:Centrosomal protein of 95 kDa [Geodia barretti]|uniref:Centrosomal protein of 95 kDa n=1 Tax=Geodia barretti TaxID=519541 RepID=A0AA35QT74_GEOBA|nr:Centrosomal protein of 95 kDa [Geodia barretti]